MADQFECKTLRQPAWIRYWFLAICVLWCLPVQADVAELPDEHRSAFGAIMPCISGDGKSLAFSYQGSIWWMTTDGGPMHRCASGTGFDVHPIWSKDGQRLAWVSGPRFGGGALQVYDMAAGQLVPLPVASAVSGQLHFDRDGRRILGVFQEGRSRRLAWYDLQTGQLQDAVAEESWPSAIRDAPGFGQPFALSHDQSRLAVITTADVSGEQGGNRGPQTELWLVSLAGGPPQRVVLWPARIHELCWRADDRAVVAATERGGVHLDLWEIPLESPEVGARKLTFGQADEASPSVSHDGRWLLYTDNRLGTTQLVLRDMQSDQETRLATSGMDFGGPWGQLELKVRQRDDGLSSVARLSVRKVDGKFHAPPGSLYRIAAGDMHFYADGGATLALPTGNYVVKAFHGPEFVPLEQDVKIDANAVTSHSVELERWTHQRAEGWISGESHIHANYGYGHWYNSPPTVRLQCAGEDLTVANLMVANSDGDGVYDREFFLGRLDPLSTDETLLYWNEEFRSTIWGHMTLLNLKHLVSPIFTGFDHTTHPYDVPTNADIADHTHVQDGLVNYTHPAHNRQDPYASAYSAKEIPIDVALGKVDSMDVMGSDHLANMPLWYRMLNCGLRIPASAGTDCFINRINSTLPGADRVYVHCAEELSYADWIRNLRAGRTFVTNGPMLRFTVNGQEAGSVITMQGPGQISVQGAAQWPAALERLEVIVNGQVAALLQGDAPDARRLEIDQPLDIQGSSWIALRATGTSGGFAHTSPIYLDVRRAPLRSPADAEYFIQWIERLRQDIRVRNRIPEEYAVHVEEQFAQALQFYRQLATAPE